MNSAISVYCLTHLLYLITHRLTMKILPLLLEELTEAKAIAKEKRKWGLEALILGYSTMEELFEDVKVMKERIKDIDNPWDTWVENKNYNPSEAEKRRAVARVELYKRLAAQKSSSDE